MAGGSMSVADRENKKPLSLQARSVSKIRQVCAVMAPKLGAACPASWGINVDSATSDEIFRWLLACQLTGALSSEQSAMRLYKELEGLDALSEEGVLRQDPRTLACLISEGGEAARAEEIAHELVEVAGALRAHFACDINHLHFVAEDEEDLTSRLCLLGKGISREMAEGFLRGLRDVWEKANPPLKHAAVLSAARLGLTQVTDPATALSQLRSVWEENEAAEVSLADLECALAKLGESFCKEKRCSACPVHRDCEFGERAVPEAWGCL
jgi:hypothetical protein